MSYLRNIKEMLNIPAGTRNVASNGYPSLTDSQVFFGSQFWHEHSQGMSQEMSLSSRNSQQSSQEGSDPTILNRYTSKPLLFGDMKDKTRTSGLLDKFEEDRKKAKERSDSDQFFKESQHIRETLINIQQLVAGTEKNTSVCQTIFEKFDSFASSLKTTLESLQRDISQMFETWVNKLSSQKEVMTELEEKLQKNGEATSELATQLKSLKSNLERLREEQEREQKMLEEALKLLNSLVPKPSDKPSPKLVSDSAIQTSPEQEQSVHNILQSCQSEGTQLPNVPCNLKHQGETSAQGHRRVFGKRRLNQKGQRYKKRPLVLSQSRKQFVPDENTEPVNPCKKSQKTSAPLYEIRDQNTLADQQNLSSGGLTPGKRGSRSGVAAGCFINPLSCWSQDSNSSECLAAIEPTLEKLSPVKQGDLWELFDSEFDF
ncbi:interactor of HORMAD1 protein 1 [Poecilia reticulata]|uniref:Coiled-coil domain containing 36 n=1 Tax=Poecilia reticulata TaxID=8081 RepID=A0A3P9MYH3_POERE|nr:PREDICTED: coiled-coil domain-containing protein 36 [Poecilia reticulata]XP_008407041.1 PREDICTED: coiled-coil domain-containing protein 36 [Poecilia reticulata]XP_017160181.1 PREDICTED: coiled-coil domain-containing protein 36 [Poecilia reticulata]